MCVSSIASCLCNDITTNVVQTICSGPSTAPCMCSNDGCMVSAWSIFYSVARSFINVNYTANYSVTNPLMLVMVVFVD